MFAALLIQTVMCPSVLADIIQILLAWLGF